MGFQLWTSPLTGYRRKGTRFDSLKKLFIDNITAQSIYEPLLCCLIDSNTSHAKDVLRARDFDIAGVKAEPEGPIIGYVKTEELENETFQDHLLNIELANVVSDSTPIANIINIFSDNDFVFVISGNQVNGIITKADINKPPVRIYLFGILSLFEMHLNLWISHFFPENCWKEILKDNRIEMAENVFNKRKGNNQELSLLECIQLCDKKEILQTSDDFLAIFNFSKKNYTKLLKRAEEIRNELAHSQNSIISNMEWNKFNSTISDAEIFLATSDVKIEENARAGIDFQDILI